MSPKATKITYYSVLTIFSLFMLMDGTAGAMRVKDGVDAMLHLGYPVYVLSIVGIAKILGTIAILQPKFRTIKEWAYSGFTINFLGAFASRLFIGDSGFLLIFPIIMLAIMFSLYFLWKKTDQVKQGNPKNDIMSIPSHAKV